MRSMTGYGQAETEIQGRIYRVEIRSVNSKYNDINLRLPQSFRSKEMDIRKRLQARLRRGKIQLVLTEEISPDLARLQLNEGVLETYRKKLQNLYPGADINHLLPALLRLPDVWQTPEEDIETLWAGVEATIDRAVTALDDYRTKEGAAIFADLEKHLEVIRGCLEQIEKLDPERMQKIRERLHKLTADIKEQADPARLELELLLFADKLDINEEKQRLRHHLDYFNQTMRSDHSEKGKKLNFIAQEMGREINTIGSKANDAGIQKCVVEMKEALEKIKEQTANIL